MFALACGQGAQGKGLNYVAVGKYDAGALAFAVAGDFHAARQGVGDAYAYAVQTTTGPIGQWNNMFNVDWGGTRDGVPNPGYAARSRDFMLGLRYRVDNWTASTGMVYLGAAKTDNPSEPSV